ncbi:hypothetical protein DV736_g3005, partial [Chaetothyriales sp. CBS 134916]
MEGTPLKAVHCPAQKAKRRRTSPHDHAVLEAAYQANSKPSKEERANLVSQVQLGEKEVQIWFQNRRQNDRRRSKPLQAHELIAHLVNSPATPLTPDPSQEQLPSQVTEPTPSDAPTLSNGAPIVSPDPSPLSDSNVASSQSTPGSDALATVEKADPANQRLAAAGELKGPKHPGTATGSSPQLSPVARATTPPSSGRKRSRGEMERAASGGASSTSPQAEAVKSREPLKRSSSVRLAMTADGAVKIKTNDELTPSPEKARPLPPGLTEEGRQRRLSRSISMASDGTGSIKSSRPVGTFGRSRDHRKWEFFCDNSTDDALSVQAEAECSGSAVGAINLIRSSSLKGRGLAMSPAPARANIDPITTSKQGKSKLVRAKSSFARLNSQSKPTAKDGSRSSRHVRAPSDSDKENWAPGTMMSEHPLRRTQPSTNRRPVLQENEAVIFPDATMARSRFMARIAKDLAASAHSPQINGFDREVFGSRRPEIAIIGAGIAGLRCAATLLRSGAKVTVFEARDRVGGRLHQQKSGGHLVDMGPNWIHGTNKNPVMQMADRTRTIVLSPDENGVVFDSDGNKKTAKESRELSATMWGLIGEAFLHSDDHSASIDPSSSLSDFLRERLSAKIKDKAKLQDALNESRMWGQFIGGPIEKQSLKFFFLEECVDGENVFVASTYHDILDEISKPVLQADVIKFGIEVTNVELVDNSVRITTPHSPATTYDEVVVTCPLGWLKQHHDKVFTPPLPPRLARAISNISYGHLEKVYITFHTAWWLTNTDTTTCPTFFNFHSPTSHPFAPSSAKLSDWNQSVVSLAHLPAPHNRPILLFYIYGDCAATVVSAVSHLTPHSGPYNAVLTSFAQPFYSKLPNYSPSSSICSPTACLATTWSADTYAGNGSYSNFQTGLEHADQDIEEMRHSGGLWERPGGLWFAGEHTAPFVALGTTTGAWWSGEAVARRICQKQRLHVVEEGEVEVNGNVNGVEHGKENAIVVLSRPLFAQAHPLPYNTIPSDDFTIPIHSSASLAYPYSRDISFILSPNLSLPSSFGSAHVGETFSCSLCANNELRPAPADSSTPPSRIASTSTHDTIRNRSFRKLYQFQATTLLSVRTKATELPPIQNTPPLLHRYTLEAQLENVSDSSTIALSRADMIAQAPFVAKSANPSSVVSATVLQPRDVHQLLFILHTQQAAQNSPPIPDITTAPTTTIDGRTILGHLRIEWRGAMGVKGGLTTGALMARKR